MSINLRPWIIGGLSLAGSIWLLDGITNFLGDWLPAIVIGSGLTWVYLQSQTTPKVVQPLSTQPLTVETVKEAVAEAEGIVNQLAKAVESQSVDGSDQNLVKLRLQIHNLLKNIDREVKDMVAEAADFAQTSPEPDPSELWTDVLVEV